MNWFWRDTARSTQIFGMDGAAVFPIMLWALHMRWWTFIVAIICMLILAVLSRFGFTGPVALRYVRSYLAGPVRFAVGWSVWHKRR